MKNVVHNDLSQKYSKWTILIHWITALLILILFFLGKHMEDLEPAEKIGLVQVHIFIGKAVFLLTAIRTWQFFKAPRPTDLETGSKINNRLTVWVHNAFYFLLWGLVLSGFTTMFMGGYVDAFMTGDTQHIKAKSELLPLKGHGILALTMMIFFLVHVFGIVKHYFLYKENTLRRMS